MITKVNFVLIFLLAAMSSVFAQKHVPLPHGATFGKHVDTLQNMPATRLEAFMGKKIRVSTTIHGKVIKVTKPKGGWFDLDAGQGRVISVHFATYNVTIPTDLKGRDVMLQGIAQKQDKAGAKNKLSFEATGLMVL